MGHQEHYINGVFYPSVTTVLSAQPKPWLEKWKEKWGSKAVWKTRAASNIGTAFHLAVDQLVWKKYPYNGAESIRIHNMLIPFARWVKEFDFVPIETELHVVSDSYKYSGTFDAIGYIKDKPKTLTIFDWKTSSNIYPDMELQLSAYAQAYYEQTGTKIVRGIIVHVSKNRFNHTLTVKEYKLGKRTFNKFLKRLEAFNREQNGEK